ncbi:uncharacterized protein LOC126908237 [Daktulosphaira vitifoliae]|uniref:uncharacterized protein LOC126908237 n=1 Tax=Daktulosphaira vitifoliae TaxID=58002 RepID=UPI0021AAF01F|nr:uncharacterized protein LOC126908237 [Daktulosphaira vitifoliae]
MKITPQKTTQIVSILKSGQSTREVARQCCVSQTTVQKIKNIGCPNALPRLKGRPKCSTPQDRRRLAHFLQMGEASSSSMAANLLQQYTGKKVSRWTASRILKEQNFLCAEKKRKPAISKKNMKARLKFAKDYKHWTEKD